MGQDLKIEQTQKLIITPELKQALNLLQMSGLELEAYVDEMLESNPLLEGNLEHTNNDTENENESEVNDRENQEQDLGSKEFDIDWHEYFADSSDVGTYTAHNRSTESSSQSPQSMDKESFETFTPTQLTFGEHLNFQLNYLDISEETRWYCEFLIGNLDSNGYLAYSLQELAEASGIPYLRLKDSLEIVQELDPPGVAARDLKECLLLQFKEKLQTEDWPKEVGMIIENHLSDIAENKLKKISTATGFSLEKIQVLVDYIRTLNPRPAASFYTGEDTIYVVPEAIIKKVDDEYVIIMNDGISPKLRISSTYKSMLANNSKASEEGKFLNSRLDAAKWLIKAIEQRRRTIYKVIECIVEVQKPFLEYGISYLKPMKLSDVAERIEMHESTVSRSTANKYVQTPRGIYSLRFFFDSSSSTSIKSRIEKLIEDEDKNKPLSDQKIASILKQEENVNVSRRTVAKYRKELKIPSSSKRKRFS